MHHRIPVKITSLNSGMKGVLMLGLYRFPITDSYGKITPVTLKGAARWSSFSMK